MRMKRKECSTPDCSSLSHSQGFCKRHYNRWRRHGDPLAGRTPDGEPEKYLNEVALTYDGDECLLWPYGRNSKGYGTIKIDGRTVSVHRITCEALNGPAPHELMHAAHLCGRGFSGCVTRRHLKWATAAENLNDKFLHGTALSRLVPGADLKIKDMRSGGASIRDIAEAFGVSKGSIESALKRISRAA